MDGPFQTISGNQSADGWKDLKDLESGGYNPDQIKEYQDNTSNELRAGGYNEDQIKKYWGQSEPDMSETKDFVDTNLKNFTQANSGEKPDVVYPHQTTYAHGYWKALVSGLQISTMGLDIRKKMPDVELAPDEPDPVMRAAHSAGAFIGDSPDIIAGGIAGAEGGLPGVMAGGMALPAVMRKAMINQIQKGDIASPDEFIRRTLGEAWEGVKAGATGYLTGLLGTQAGAVTSGLGAVVSKTAQVSTEIAANATIAKAFEGKLPERQDFVDSAMMIGGLHAVGVVAPKLLNTFAATGEHPASIAAAAENDVELKQNLTSHDLESPPEAVPTEIKKVTEPPKEEGGQPMDRHQLVAKDIGFNKPEPPAAPKGRLPEVQEIIDKIGKEPKEAPKKFGELFDQWYAKNIDYTDPLKIAVEAYKSETGRELPASEDPHIQARLFAGHVDQLRMILDHGVQDANGNFTGQGINDVYNQVEKQGLNQQDFDAYSMAKRGIELEDRGLKPWSDFNREGAESTVEKLGPQYETLHRSRVRALNEVMTYGVRNGVIDPDMALGSMEKNKEYLPFNRIIEPDELTGAEASGGPGKGKLLKKIEGSDLEIKNPRVSAYQNIAAIVKRVEINNVRKMAMDNLVDENGENQFLREVPLGNGKLSQNQIPLWRDGKMSALEGTPAVIDSLKRLEGDKTMMDMTTKIAGAFSKAVRVGQVADPGFGVRHWFRASVMSGVYSQTGQIPFLHPMGYLSEFLGGKSEAYKNWVYDGGAGQGYKDLEDSYVSNGLEESDKKFPFVNQAWNVISKPLEAAELYIKMTDNLSRFTEYKRAIDQGQSRDQAAFLSREVSPDYQKIGLQRSALRTAVAFQGAHINSLDRMAQAFKEDTQGTILRMSALGAVSAALWAANRTDPEIDSLPDYKKDLYWNFNVTRMFDNKYNDESFDGQHAATVFSLPKPWAPGILFGSGTERALDAYFKKDPHAFDGFAKSLTESVIPSVIPNLAQPILDQMADKNMFSGRQLVNENQKKEAPEMRYQPYTSETAKQLGKLIGYVPAISNIGPSLDPLGSPAVIDNYIQAWSGQVGSWAVRISDAAIKSAKGNGNVGPHSADSAAEYPILSEFLTRFPSAKSRPIDQFYRNLDQTNQALTSAKKGDKSDAETLMNAVPLNDTAKAISTMKKTIINVQNMDIPNVEKRQLVDKLLFQMNSAARLGNQRVDEFRKSFQNADGGN